MPGLPPELYNLCRAVLVQCDQFENYKRLRAVFMAVDVLSPFRFKLQEADSAEALIELNLPILIESKLKDHRPIFPIFLQVLRNLYDHHDHRWDALNELQDQVSAVLIQPEPEPALSPRRRHLLLDRLLQLDFRPQVKLFREVTEEHRIAAFLIHGPPDHGQRMLAYRLTRFRPEWQTGQQITVDAGSNGVGKSSRALWGQVARKLGLPSWTTSEELATKVAEWWLTQDVLFIFHTVDYMPADLLSAWIEEFWGPLVTMARQIRYQTHRRTHLLLFLVDYAGTVCQSDMPLAQHPHDLHTVPWPLLLPTIEPFPELELEIWLDAAAEVLTSGLSVGTLLSEPYNGIPEFVYEKICEHCGLGWEGEIAV
jgi:hypothetical protein